MLKFYLIQLIGWVLWIEYILIIASVLLTWFRPRRWNRTYSQTERLVGRLTEPVLGPIRDKLPNAFGMDLSPLVAIILLRVVGSLLTEIIYRVL